MAFFSNKWPTFNVTLNIFLAHFLLGFTYKMSLVEAGTREISLGTEIFTGSRLPVSRHFELSPAGMRNGNVL